MGKVDNPDCEMKDYFNFAVMTFWTVAWVYAGVFKKSASAFLKLDIAMNIIHGLPWLVAPVTMMKIVYPLKISLDELNIDGGHMFLAFAAGILMLYTAAMVYTCTDAEDDTVTTGVLYSKLVMAGIFVMNEIQTYMRHRPAMGDMHKWLPRDIYFNMSLVMLITWAITAVILLRQFDSWGGYTEHMNRLNFHIRVDVVFAVIAGLGMFAFPDWTQIFTPLYQKTDAMHAFMSRCLGVMLIHSALLSYRSTSFLLEMPKVRFLFFRLVACVTIALARAAVMHHYQHATLRDILKSNGLLTISALNALAGYMYSRNGKLHD